MLIPSLRPYGWSDRWVALLADVHRTHPAAVPGRVARHDGTALLVALPDGVAHVPVPPSRTEPVVVGDWVAVSGGAVVAVLPRSSLLRRRDPRADIEHLLAANVDVVAVVCGLDRPVKPGRVERTVALAWDAGAVPVVVLTKADVLDPTAVDAVVAELTGAVPGLDVVAVSSATGEGLARVRASAAGRTVVLVGESGAGKSTLVNALLGTDVAATGEVRAGDAKGRHTTTTRFLHPGPDGMVLLDSPGIRAVGLWTDPDTVAASYTDVEELAEACRFRDCAHGAEPGCAVTAAVAAGSLPARRLEGWRALRREAEAAALRADEHARRQAERRFGRVTKDAQRRKGRE